MEEAERSKLYEVLKRWAREAAAAPYQAQHVYLFGSLIYLDGKQFSEQSDIDLVVVMPKVADAAARTRWLTAFSEHKHRLEGQLVPELHRAATEPIVSIVAITEAENELDVHKDGHRQFFSQNCFEDLLIGGRLTGIPGSAATEPSRFVAAALSFVQKTRNAYLAVAYAKVGGISSYQGSDPIPKAFMRAAAMAARASDNTLELGAEYDLQAGLDRISAELMSRRKSKGQAYFPLHDLVSIRRGARGAASAVKPEDQVLLAELIYDIALAIDGDSQSPPQGPGPNADVGRAEIIQEMGEQTAPLDASKPDAPHVIPETDSDQALPHVLGGSSTLFFHDRFKQSFPGDRGITWYDDRAQIGIRLAKLFAQPLVFADGIPLWWWRYGNLQIESFERQVNGIYIMNVDELDICQIASVAHQNYKRCFVYIETAAMNPTGLYKVSAESISAEIKESGYYYEEYGLYDGYRPITRAEYDDGAAWINGELVDTGSNARLRVRYITPYNFIVAPIGSPINNPDFDGELEKMLNDALRGDSRAAVSRIAEAVKHLPVTPEHLGHD